LAENKYIFSDPVATERYTVEQLKAKGIVGFYVEE